MNTVSTGKRDFKTIMEKSLKNKIDLAVKESTTMYDPRTGKFHFEIGGKE